MRYHPVPIQFNEDEKIVGGKLTLRQIGFLIAGFIATLLIPFILHFLPWFLMIIPMGFVIYQTIKFTFFKKFGWDYYIYFVKARRCKRRQSVWVYRKSRRG